MTWVFAYTFSNALGTASTDSSTVSPFFTPRSRNYGPLSFDRKHVDNFRYTMKIPALGKRLQQPLLGKVTDGWELVGITRG
jgi:hypothetical protein